MWLYLTQFKDLPMILVQVTSATYRMSIAVSLCLWFVLELCMPQLHVSAIRRYRRWGGGRGAVKVDWT